MFGKFIFIQVLDLGTSAVGIATIFFVLQLVGTPLQVGNASFQLHDVVSEGHDESPHASMVTFDWKAILLQFESYSRASF